MWKCGNDQVGRTFAESSFTGHQNEKNFVGLATDGEYIACGSEDNSLYLYYKGTFSVFIEFILIFVKFMSFFQVTLDLV